MSQSLLPKKFQIPYSHFDNTPLAVIELNHLLQIMFWSQEAEAIFGWSEIEVRGKKIFDISLVLEDEVPRFNETFSQLINNYAERVSGRRGNRNKNGAVVHCHWSSSVMKNEKGEVVSVVSFVQDVTGEVEREKSIARLHERFFLIADSTNDGIWEWDVEADTVWVNESYCKTFGYDPKQYPDYYDEWLRRIHPHDKEAFLQSILGARQRQERQWSGEFRFLLADGSYGYILQRTIFIYRIDGQTQKVLGITLDITKQKKAEEQLKENERQLELIYNTINDVLFLLDVKEGEQYQFISVNHAFLAATGLVEDQVTGRWVHDVIPEPSLSLVLTKYKAAIETKSSVQWEEVTLYPAGEKTGIVTVTPVFNSEGQCFRLVGSVHDITEQKGAKEALGRSLDEIRSLAGHLQIVREEERTALAREIHDELGQVLTGLKMDLSWLKQIQTLTPEQVQKRVQSVLLILDQSIYSVRNISAELRPALLDDLGLTEALQWQAVMFTRRYGIPVHFSEPLPERRPERSVVTAFFRIFQEALTNIARHAKATKVTVRFSVDESRLSLSIIDNGKGFPSEEKEGKKTWGLLGMKERMLLLKGTFSVTSTENGTHIFISAPLNNAEYQT